VARSERVRGWDTPAGLTVTGVEVDERVSSMSVSTPWRPRLGHEDDDAGGA
jgi:hypothetical protein